MNEIQAERRRLSTLRQSRDLIDAILDKGSEESIPVDVIIVVNVEDRLLVDLETFERVQNKITSHQTGNARPRYSHYILSGILYCGHCGGKLSGKGYNKKNIPRYYACTTSQVCPGACVRYQVPQIGLENYVLKLIEKELFQPAVLKKIKAAIFKRAKSTTAFKSDTKTLQSQVAALDKKIAKGTENLLLANPDDMDDLSALLAEWRKERSKLQTELETTITTAGGVNREEKARRAVAELDNLKKSIRSADPMRVRAALKALIAEIRLWFEPYGKQTRFTRGFIRFKNEIALLSTGLKTESPTSSAPDTAIGSPPKKELP